MGLYSGRNIGIKKEGNNAPVTIHFVYPVKKTGFFILSFQKHSYIYSAVFGLELQFGTIQVKPAAVIGIYEFYFPSFCGDSGGFSILSISI